MSHLNNVNVLALKAGKAPRNSTSYFSLSLLLFYNLFYKWKRKETVAASRILLTLTCFSVGCWSLWCRQMWRKKIIFFIRVHYLQGFLNVSSCCQSHRIRCDFPFAGIYSKYATRLSAFFSSQKQGSPLKGPRLTQSSLFPSHCTALSFSASVNPHICLPPSPLQSLSPSPCRARCHRIGADMWSPGDKHTHTRVPGTAAQLGKMSFS